MSIDEKPALMNADPNLGLLGSDPDIADQRERQPAADGHTVDRGDHRDVELVKPGEQVRQTDLGVVVDLERRGPRTRRLGPRLAGATQIGSGTESASGTGEDRDPNLAAAERIQGMVHAVDQRSVDGVQALRPVQGDTGDVVLESCKFHWGFHC
jgi:hypothetical protein